MTPRSRARRNAASKTAASESEASAPAAATTDPVTEAPAAEAPVLTLESAMKASAAAFHKAARTYPKGAERNAAYAEQARTFLAALGELGLMDSTDPTIVAWIRQGRKNIAAVENATTVVAEVEADAATEAA